MGLRGEWGARAKGLEEMGGGRLTVPSAKTSASASPISFWLPYAAAQSINRYPHLQNTDPTPPT